MSKEQRKPRPASTTRLDQSSEAILLPRWRGRAQPHHLLSRDVSSELMSKAEEVSRQFDQHGNGFMQIMQTRGQTMVASLEAAACSILQTV